MTREDEKVIEAMHNMGGGFARALSRAAMLADSENLTRIKATWPDYWERYKQMSEQKTYSVGDVVQVIAERLETYDGNDLETLANEVLEGSSPPEDYRYRYVGDSLFIREIHL